MGVFNQYPYSDYHELNLDWVIAKLREVEKSIIGIKESIEGDVMLYVQEVLRPYEERLQQLIGEVNSLSGEVNETLQQYDREIDAFKEDVKEAIEQIRRDLQTSIDAVNALTDTKIETNNIYLLNEISKNFGTAVRVINPFTGAYVSIQEMVDYLSSFHITDSLTYTVMVERALTYDELIALNATYTELVLNGNTIYVK